MLSEPTKAAPANPISLRAHVRIARVDHWIKNIFILPGIVLALSLDRNQWHSIRFFYIVFGIMCSCLVTSSNYVLNELLDAPFDQFHPLKSRRAVPSGQVHRGWAYFQWLALAMVGLGGSALVNSHFLAANSALWIMGIIYNVSPFRTKDIVYVDVLSEAINSPLRMLAGWYLTNTQLIPIASALLSYWMMGCYLMAIKRFAEYRAIGDSKRAATYRRSFAAYTEPSLLVSIIFYACHSMLFFGAFIMRYRLELVLSFPLIAAVMTIYFYMSFQQNSPVQHPELLYRQRLLMAAVVACGTLMTALLFVDLSIVARLFPPSILR